MAFKIINKINFENVNKVMLQCCECGTRVYCNADKVDEQICPVCSDRLHDKADLTQFAVSYKAICERTAKDIGNFKEDTDYIMSKSYVPRTQLRLWNILDVVGQIKSKGLIKSYIITKYVMQCKNCGYIRLEENSHIDEKVSELDKVVCNKCKLALIERNTDAADKEWQAYEDRKNSIEAKRKKQEDVERRNKEVIESGENKTTVEKITGRASDINRMLRKQHINKSVVDVSVVDGEPKATFLCGDCNGIYSVSALNRKQLLGFKCPGCLAKEKIGPTYTGILKRNIVGTTINGVTCVGMPKDENDVELSCTICKKKIRIKKINFLLGKYVHKCKDKCNTIDVECCNKDCNRPITIKRADLVSGELNDGIICPECGSIIKYSTIKSASVEDDISTERRYELKGYDAAVSGTYTTYKDKGLSVKNRALYIHEGKEYHNCWCHEHKQGLVLNDEEIANYDHSQCNNGVGLIVTDDMLANVTLVKDK